MNPYRAAVAGPVAHFHLVDPGGRHGGDAPTLIAFEDELRVGDLETHAVHRRLDVKVGWLVGNAAHDDVESRPMPFVAPSVDVNTR